MEKEKDGEEVIIVDRELTLYSSAKMKASVSNNALLQLIESAQGTTEMKAGCTKVRIKFLDGYVMQGTFSGKEKVREVVKFIKDNLSTPEREFRLFETPPKRVLKDMTKTLKA